MDQLRGQVGQVAACALLGQSRATAHRRVRPVVLGPAPRRTRASPASKLTDAETQEVLEVTTYGKPAAVHADRGTSMTSRPVAALLADLGVTKSRSRPEVSNDNPYSGAHFTTLKYAPDFPDRFGSLADAKAHCEAFFGYDNHEHRHSGIGLHTPASVHHGTAKEIREQRAQTLAAAYAAHPDRFTRTPTPPALPETVWINQPAAPTTDGKTPTQSA